MAALTPSQVMTSSQLLVIKIGSSLLVGEEDGALRKGWLRTIAEDIAEMHKSGQKILIVSSGAIALGRQNLNLQASSLKLEESQAAAAAGQIHLARAWHETLGALGITVAQILLTSGDTEERRRYLNARNTLTTLLSLDAIPVINENDTIATNEIRYGDNDQLAARVANMIGAECLVLLSTVDGLLSCDPAQGKGGLIAQIDQITPDIEALAGDAGTGLHRGGMKAKLAAAHIAARAGCHMIIAQGAQEHPLKDLRDGRACSWFPAHATPQAARKTWIAGTLKPRGAVIVDEGAAQALRRRQSLLPAGIKKVEGQFSRGDAVSVQTSEGEEIARGLSAYSSADAAMIAGHKSGEIEAILGYRGRTAMIHADDLAILKDEKNGTTR